MIVAGIHGGYEWNTIALADELITHFDANPQDIPENVTLYILRSLNPDGDARGHDKFGRANERGVDLNRNFPVNWQEDWDRDGCWKDLPLTGGDFPASEPETRALIRFIEQHHVDALISYHSAALGVFPGGDPGTRTPSAWRKPSPRSPAIPSRRSTRAASTRGRWPITPSRWARRRWTWNSTTTATPISRATCKPC
jgi:Zinc carboxypeptidase.